MTKKHLAVRVEPELRRRIEAIQAQYNPHATLTDWLTAWLTQMVGEIEAHGADPQSLLPPRPPMRHLRRS